VGLFSVHVHQHAVGGGSLAAVAGDGISVIDMRVFPDVELHIPVGVQADLEISFRLLEFGDIDSNPVNKPRPAILTPDHFCF